MVHYVLIRENGRQYDLVYLTVMEENGGIATVLHGRCHDSDPYEMADRCAFPESAEN